MSCLKKQRRKVGRAWTFPQAGEGAEKFARPPCGPGGNRHISVIDGDRRLRDGVVDSRTEGVVLSAQAAISALYKGVKTLFDNCIWRKRSVGDEVLAGTGM
jgi:hypothetical protein